MKNSTMKLTLSKPTHDYMAIDPKCGCIVGLVADIPEVRKDTAIDVAEFIKSGYLVERVSRESEQFKNAIKNFGHHCQEKQLNLLWDGGTHE